MNKHKTTRQGTRRALRGKKAALALAVSLWTAGGGVAGATSPSVYIGVDTSNAIHIDDGTPNGAVTPPSGTATALIVTGDWPTTHAWSIYGGKSANGAEVTNYSVTLDGASVAFLF